LDRTLSAVLPRRLAPDQPAADRHRWRIVRLDTHAELPGEILSADVDAGIATMQGADGAAVDYSLGAGGIAIVGKERL
jgi:hypothetical protein